MSKGAGGRRPSCLTCEPPATAVPLQGDPESSPGPMRAGAADGQDWAYVTRERTILMIEVRGLTKRYGEKTASSVEFHAGVPRATAATRSGG